MATHSSILAWETPYTEEPGGLHAKGSQRVKHDWVTNTFTSLSFRKLESDSKTTEKNKIVFHMMGRRGLSWRREMNKRK